MDILQIIVAVVAALSLMVLTIAIHEVGHLVFGLACKRKFVSINVCGITLYRATNGRIKFWWNGFSLKSPAGHCFMTPASLEDRKLLPVVLFMLGGGLLILIPFQNMVCRGKLRAVCGVF